MTAGISRSGMDEAMVASTPPITPSYSARLRRLWINAVRLAPGSVALVLFTVFGYKYHLNAATIVPLYLFVVVLQALAGGVMTASIITVIAGACLGYLFFPPLFSFRIEDPLNRWALFTFLVMSHVVTRLVSNAHQALRDKHKRAAPVQTAAQLGASDRERDNTTITNPVVTPPDSDGDKIRRGLPIPADILFQQVSHIISSRTFRKSIRLRRLLEFIVEATVKGETNSLKEWVIGTDVYNRGEDFDPRLDPIVRTEIRRLRRKLREYFETEGRDDAVVIEVPKGSYVPSFRDRRHDDFFKLPGETIGDYLVLNRFDEGFDTVSYRVRENTSEQVFALKVISGAALGSPGVRQALDAEMAAVIPLRHENIGRVYGWQHSGQSICIVTEYFEGQAITDVINQDLLTWEQTLEIARQLISGLAAAHQLHIVHGNLNPGNVIVALGQPTEKPVLKIMGMGMCSLVGERSGTSPNLPRGECCAATIDEKSDVWGAGTVLNQLFSVWLRKCDTSAAVWQGEFSERQRFALTAILARCVSASPTDRYPDAVELEKAMDLLGIKSYLRGWGRDEQPNRSESYKQVSYWRQSSRRTAIRKVTTATLMCVVVMVVAGATQWVSRPRGLEAVCRLGVLPVECPSGDQECEAMGHALTSSLGTRLVKTGGLELVPVDISSKFKGKRPPVLQVASRLKADYLLTGTIEKRAEARRFSARIIRVADHSLEWAGHFECSWNTLLEIQSQLLSDVLVVVNRKRPALTRLRPPESFSAQTAEDHELYARARHAVDTLVTVRERVYFDSAEKQLQSVLKSNPEFNDARILLAQLYYQEIWGSPQRSRLLENSRFLLEAAIQREPGRAEAHALLGGVFAETGQKQRGIEFARRALTLGPLESTPHRELAKLYAEAGFFEAALVEEDRALALDPSNLTALTLKILLLSWMGKQAEADAALWVLREWQPEGLANRLEADRELRTGNYAAASHLIAAALKHAGNPVNTQSSELARYLCAVLGGERSEARKAFRKHPDQPPRFFDHYILLAAQLGDARRVVDYIRHNPMYFNYRYLATEPRLSPVRNEPAFQALLKETYSRWQGDLARYGPSLPALPEPLPHPAGTSRTAVMAGLTPR